MKYKRDLILYKGYFKDFYDALPFEVEKKTDYVLQIIMTEDVIPVKYFRHIVGVKGLYEIRVEYESNIYRIFCCLDEGQIVVLFNGFHKKTQKTPSKQIKQARKIMNEYFKEKKGH